MLYQGKEINSIIFDLGDVIIDLDIPETIARFAKISDKSGEEVKEICGKSDVFLNYEKGLISDGAFRSGANRLFGTELTDEEFDAIWNGMLIHIPAGKIEMLIGLAAGHRLFLLSNTNNIHITRFASMFGAVTGGKPIEDYFEKTYYSHQIGMRKPDEEIFNFVLRENNLDPDTTLFLDDNHDNIRGAAATGIQTFHVPHPSAVYNVFK